MSFSTEPHGGKKGYDGALQVLLLIIAGLESLMLFLRTGPA